MIRDQFKTQISRLKGLYLFSEGKYDKAISFLQRGQVPTRQVLSLYPSIIPDDLPTDMYSIFAFSSSDRRIRNAFSLREWRKTRRSTRCFRFCTREDSSYWSLARRAVDS